MPHDFLLILHDLVVNMYLPLYTSQNLQPHELWDIYYTACNMAQNHFRHITQGRFICKGDSKLRIRSCSQIHFHGRQTGLKRGVQNKTYLVKGKKIRAEMMKNLSLGRIQFQIFETTRPNKQRMHLHPIVWRHCSF